MEFNEIVEKLKEPEKICEPNEMAILIQHISGFITDFELERDELELQEAMEWENVKWKTADEKLSDTSTNMRMRANPISIRLKDVKRRLGQLKRYRSDLTRRLDVFIGIRKRP